MKVRKGEVVLSISPNDLPRYRKANWTLVQEPTPDKIKKYNETQRLKRLAKKNESENSQDVK